MATPGRKPGSGLPPEARRTGQRFLGVTVTAEEQEKLNAAAAASGKGKVAWARETLLAQAERKKKMETTLRYEESHFGLQNMGRDENGWSRVSADGGETCLPLPMSEEDFSDMIADVLAWREQDELSESETASLRILLHMGEEFEAE